MKLKSKIFNALFLSLTMENDASIINPQQLGQNTQSNVHTTYVINEKTYFTKEGKVNIPKYMVATDPMVSGFAINSSVNLTNPQQQTVESATNGHNTLNNILNTATQQTLSRKKSMYFLNTMNIKDSKSTLAEKEALYTYTNYPSFAANESYNYLKKTVAGVAAIGTHFGWCYFFNENSNIWTFVMSCKRVVMPFFENKMFSKMSGRFSFNSTPSPSDRQILKDLLNLMNKLGLVTKDELSMIEKNNKEDGIKNITLDEKLLKKCDTFAEQLQPFLALNFYYFIGLLAFVLAFMFQQTEYKHLNAFNILKSAAGLLIFLAIIIIALHSMNMLSLKTFTLYGSILILLHIGLLVCWVDTYKFGLQKINEIAQLQKKHGAEYDPLAQAVVVRNTDAADRYLAEFSMSLS